MVRTNRNAVNTGKAFMSKSQKVSPTTKPKAPVNRRVFGNSSQPRRTYPGSAPGTRGAQ